MKKKSKLGWVNVADFFKGLAVAVSSAVLSSLYSSFTGTFDAAAIHQAIGVGTFAAGGYLLKQLATNSEGVPLTKDPPKSDTGF